VEADLNTVQEASGFLGTRAWCGATASPDEQNGIRSRLGWWNDLQRYTLL
jgi:hypothetical protein